MNGDCKTEHFPLLKNASILVDNRSSLRKLASEDMCAIHSLNENAFNIITVPIRRSNIYYLPLFPTSS